MTFRSPRTSSRRRRSSLYLSSSHSFLLPLVLAILEISVRTKCVWWVLSERGWFVLYIREDRWSYASYKSCFLPPWNKNKGVVYSNRLTMGSRASGRNCVEKNTLYFHSSPIFFFFHPMIPHFEVNGKFQHPLRNAKVNGNVHLKVGNHGRRKVRECFPSMIAIRRSAPHCHEPVAVAWLLLFLFQSGTKQHDKTHDQWHDLCIWEDEPPLSL